MLTKVLEQKWVIRFFGLALMVAPFLNIFVSGEAALDPGQHMTWRLFWEFTRGIPVSFKVLEISSLGIGVLMLRGSVTAWRFLLALLGGFILLQFVHLGQGVKHDKTAWIFIGVNVLIFFFIADQLVLKPRADEKPRPESKPEPKPAPKPVPQQMPLAPTQMPPPILAVVAPTVPGAHRVSRKNIVIDLNGVGKFARLIDISPDGLRLRCLSEAPQGLSSRRLLVTLGGVDLQLRFARQMNQDLMFEWENLSQLQIRSLNVWIRAISAA